MRSFARRVNRSTPNFKFEIVSGSFIVNTLQRLKTSKASGLDDKPPRLLKDATEVIAKPLTRIINALLLQGTLPNELKYARVTSLFKKGVATDMDNYRPTSVLSVVSKVVEGAVHHQLHSFLSLLVPSSVVLGETIRMNLQP